MKKHLKHLVKAGRYSFNGLASTYRHEIAFRQEIFIFAVLFIVSFFLDVSPLEQAVMLASWLLVLAAELINSAVESLIERYGNEFHELAGRAKDQASAAVMLTVLLAVMVWVIILFT